MRRLMALSSTRRRVKGSVVLGDGHRVGGVWMAGERIISCEGWGDNEIAGRMGNDGAIKDFDALILENASSRACRNARAPKLWVCQSIILSLWGLKDAVLTVGTGQSRNRISKRLEYVEQAQQPRQPSVVGILPPPTMQIPL